MVRFKPGFLITIIVPPAGDECCEKQQFIVKKDVYFTFHDFSVVKQRVAVTVQPHQSSKHLPINKKLFERRSDPPALWSYIDHVLGEVEPANGTDLISVVEKINPACYFFFSPLCNNRLFTRAPLSIINIYLIDTSDSHISPLQQTSGSSCAFDQERKDLHVS